MVGRRGRERTKKSTDRHCNWGMPIFLFIAVCVFQSSTMKTVIMMCFQAMTKRMFLCHSVSFEVLSVTDFTVNTKAHEHFMENLNLHVTAKHSWILASPTLFLLCYVDPWVQEERHVFGEK